MFCFEGQDVGGFQYIRAEKHILMNREGHHCHDYDQEQSSFSECVSTYVMNSTSCKVSNEG